MKAKRRYCVLFLNSKIIVKGVSPKARDSICRIMNEEYKWIPQKTAEELAMFIGYPSYEADSNGNLYTKFPDEPFMSNDIVKTAIENRNHNS